MISPDELDQLQDIYEQIESLMHDADNIVSMTSEEQRWHGYVHGHIMTALNDDSHYLGSSMTTFKDVIEALEAEATDNGE